MRKSSKRIQTSHRDGTTAEPSSDPPSQQTRPFLRSGSRRKRLAENTTLPTNERVFTASRGLFAASLLFIFAFVLLQSGVLAQDATQPVHPAASPNVLRDLFVVFLLVLVTGMFVLAETALLTLRSTRLEQLVEEGNASAKLVLRLKQDPTRMLATLQVGLTLVQLFSAGEATDRFREPFSTFLRSHFADTFLAGSAELIAFITIISTVGLVSLVVGEITPKSIAITHAEKIALLMARPTLWLQTFTKPLVWLVTMLSNLIVRPLFGVRPTFHTSVYTEEEIKTIVEQSEEHGVIETEEKEMIHRLFEFGDTVVRRVMTPRSDITAVEADVDVDALIHVVTASGHSRLPVYDDDLDNVIGIIHVKDVLKAVTSGQKNLSIRSMLREPYVVPESKRVDDLLSEFRRTHTQIAIVRDADGGTVSGLVTLEDLLEEIVGDIQDEYDQEEAPLWKQLDPNTCLVDGRVEIEDFNDRFGVDLPTEEGVDTVGGFVFNLMGHQPAQGEKAVWHTIEFKVEETDGKRIQRVCVAKQTFGRDETTTEAPEPESALRNGNGSAPSEVSLPSRDTVNR